MKEGLTSTYTFSILEVRGVFLCILPKLTLWKFCFSNVNPIFSPKSSTSFKGFTPGESMKKMGVEGLVSSKDFSNSTVLLSTYLAPNFSSINALKKKQAIIDCIYV